MDFCQTKNSDNKELTAIFCPITVIQKFLDFGFDISVSNNQRKDMRMLLAEK